MTSIHQPPTMQKGSCQRQRDVGKCPYRDRVGRQLTRSPANRSDKKRYLHGVYLQLVRSRKGHQKNGDFRNFVEEGSQNGKEFVTFLWHQLTSYGMGNHARRLREQYTDESDTRRVFPLSLDGLLKVMSVPKDEKKNLISA